MVVLGLGLRLATQPLPGAATVTTWVAAAVGKWARLRQTLGESSGGPLTHSSYTTRGDTARLKGANPFAIVLATLA